MKQILSIPLLSSIMILLCLTGAAADEGTQCDETPELTVRGEAILHVPADQLRLNMGVVTDAVTAGEALEQNTARMEDVIKAIETVGLSKNDYQTGQFQIQPRWSPRPRQAPQDWRPHIVGYTVTNRLTIKTVQLHLAGKLIGAASQAGANEINSILFDLADPRTYRAEAIAAATANAITDARSLASAASVRLVKVLSLKLDDAVATPVRIRTEGLSQRAAMAMDVAEPPISSGDVVVRASVHLIYQIEQKE